MLFNPAWKKPRHSTPAQRRPELNITNFRKFLESKPPWLRYDYTNVERCALGQFLNHMNARYIDLHLSAPEYMASFGDTCDWHLIAGRESFTRKGHTFGAAARRARLVEAGGWRRYLAEAVGIL